MFHKEQVKTEAPAIKATNPTAFPFPPIRAVHEGVLLYNSKTAPFRVVLFPSSKGTVLCFPSQHSAPTSTTGWGCPGVLGCAGGSETAGLFPGQALGLAGMGLAGKALWGGRGLEISYARKKQFSILSLD